MGTWMIGRIRSNQAWKAHLWLTWGLKPVPFPGTPHDGKMFYDSTWEHFEEMTR